MQIFKAYKVLLDPNGYQTRLMCKFAGNSRKIYNLCLSKQQENYRNNIKYTNYNGMSKWILDFKNQYPYLKDSIAQCLQQTIMDLDGAYKAAFKGIHDFPIFKSKNKSQDGFRVPQLFTVDQVNNRIKLPKLDWMKYRDRPSLEGKIKSITVSRDGDKWYASILTEQTIEEPIHPATTIVGMDLGVVRFATMSNGEVIEPLELKKHQSKLKFLQRTLARQTKGGSNYSKTKERIRKLHLKIRNIRNDFLHKTSTEICKNHAIIVLEDLKVKNMSASAKGTVENPGKNVKAKSGLNRVILQQCWGEFRRQCEYKQKWKGGKVIVVPPHYTSQTCPNCKCIDKQNRKTQSQFKCMGCGYENNADLVGALNILAAGHAALKACAVGEVVNSLRQEPVEVTFEDVFKSTVEI